MVLLYDCCTLAGKCDSSTLMRPSGLHVDPFRQIKLADSCSSWSRHSHSNASSWAVFQIAFCVFIMSLYMRRCSVRGCIVRLWVTWWRCCEASEDSSFDLIHVLWARCMCSNNRLLAKGRGLCTITNHLVRDLISDLFVSRVPGYCQLLTHSTNQHSTLCLSYVSVPIWSTAEPQQA